MPKKAIKIYILCGIGMLLLIILAFFLPQGIWSIQDRYQVNNLEVEERSNIDITQMHSEYEKQMYERMNSLTLQDLGAVTVAAIDYEQTNDTELYSLLENIFTGEWIGRLSEITLGVYSDVLTAAFFEVEDCKKYIVYGEDYQDGVALMMWYLDIYMEEYDTRVKLLVDSETESIYYIKVVSYEGQQKNNYATNISYQTDWETLFWEIQKLMWTHMEYYSDYYEVDEEKAGYNWDDCYPSIKLDDTQLLGKYVLPYSEGRLEFQLVMTNQDTLTPKLEMGMTEIGELIPEMMQN